MKKCKYLMLCTVLAAGTLFMTGCGNNGDMNGTEAPYEDQTNRKVNDANNDSSLQDAGRNLWDSMEDTGDAIRDGIDNLGTDMNDTNNMNRSDDANNTNNMGNTDNANNANNAGGTNMGY